MVTYLNVQVLVDGIQRHDNGALVVNVYKGDLTDLINTPKDTQRLLKNATVMVSDDGNSITITSTYTPPCSEKTIKRTIVATNFIFNLFEEV